MTTDDIIRMAEQAGLPMAWVSETGVLKWSDLERFAALVAAAEREKLLGRPLNGLSQEQAREWFKEVSKPLEVSPRREWRGLSVDEIDRIAKQEWGEDHEIFWFDDEGIALFARALETALKEKNT